MRVVVVGAGAVGSLLGAVLSLAGEDVTLVSRGTRERAAADLTLTEPDGERRVTRIDRVGIDRLADLERPDVIVLAVKLPSLAAAVADIAAWPTTPTVTVQNGIGAEALVRELRPAAPLVAGSLTASVELPAADRVVRLRRGGLGLAAVTAGGLLVARDLAAAFERGGLPSRAMRDAAAMKWSKLLANLVGNATSALLDVEPADVYADQPLFDVERRQLLETLAVMRALHARVVAIPGADARLLALGLRLPSIVARPVLRRVVGRARGGKSPSLRIHLHGDDRAGERALEPSEARWLNGAVAAEGARLGVPTPVNSALARLVDEAATDPVRRASLRAHPERLLAALGG